MSLKLGEGGGRSKSRRGQQKLSFEWKFEENTVFSKNSSAHQIKLVFLLLPFYCKITFQGK